MALDFWFSAVKASGSTWAATIARASSPLPARCSSWAWWPSWGQHLQAPGWSRRLSWQLPDSQHHQPAACQTSYWHLFTESLLVHEVNALQMHFEPSIELMPQSMTTAPGLIHDSLTISARPMATTKMSAAAAWFNHDNKEGNEIVD